MDDENFTSPSVSDSLEFYSFVNQQMGLHRMADLLKKIDLGPYLLSLGSITMFAPTDEAFSLAPRELTTGLDTSSETVRQFLLRHVTRGRVTQDNIRNDVTLPSFDNDSSLRLNVYARGPMMTVSGAQLLNGSGRFGSILVQPVDRILDPPSTKQDLMRVMQKDFPALHDLFLKSGLGLQLSSGTFTVFAPTDKAIAALPQQAQDILLSNSTLLRRVLLSHVVPGAYYSAALSDGFSLRSLGGEALHFSSRRGLILVNGVPVIRTDIPVSNGVLHGLNRMIIPADLAQACDCLPRYEIPSVLSGSVQTPSPDASDNSSELKPPEKEDDSGERSLEDVTTISPISSTQSSSTSGMEKSRPPSIVQLLAAPMVLPDGRQVTFSIARDLMRRTYFLNVLMRTGNFTVLLPTDDAFQNLGGETLKRIRHNPRLLRRVLLWHVAKGRLPDTVVSQPGRILTLGGPALVSVQQGGKAIFIGGARVLAVRPTSNGVVYAVDRVAYPLPRPNLIVGLIPTAAGPQEAKPGLNVEKEESPFSLWRTLIDGVPEAKEALRSRGTSYTMFAPTNAAFAALPRPFLLRLLSEEPLRRELVWSHLMPGAHYPSTFLPGTIMSTVNGNKLRFGRLPNGFSVNEIPVTKPKVVTSNGILYIVDRLLFPGASPKEEEIERKEEEDQENIDKPEEEMTLEKIAEKHKASNFLKWIRDSGVQNLIQNLGRCTVFLPTDSALRTMSPTLRVFTLGNPLKFERFVRFHISPVPINPEVFRSTNDITLPTLLQRTPVRCNSYDHGKVFTASGSPVINTISTPNVTAIIINRTLAAPVGDLTLVAAKSPLLRNFSKILRAAEYTEQELTNGGPFTLFAPSQCAFAKLSPEEYQKLITDIEIARNFIKRHLVRGCFYTSGLMDGMQLTAEAGNILYIRTPPECITVNGVKMKYGDLSATNGVLHIIADIL